MINTVLQKKINSTINPRKTYFTIPIYLKFSTPIQPAVQPLKKSKVNVAFTSQNR